MPTEDQQLHGVDHGKDLDNQDRNQVRPQTEEAYGDQPMHAQTLTTQQQHFPGQPLETTADHEANEELREEQYERAIVDPVYRAQQKIEIDEDDQDRDDYVADDGLALGTHIPLPEDYSFEETEREDALADEGRTDVDQAQAEGVDAMHPAQPVVAGGLDEDDHAGESARMDDNGAPVYERDAAEQNEVDRAAVEDQAPDHDDEA